MRRKVLTIVAGLALSVVSPPLEPGGAPSAEACATAPPAAESVRIASESAIIVWDEKSKKEHFIRRASFSTSAKDFGFLVPTPTKPELAEIDDGVFDALDWATRPKVEIREERSGVELGSAFLLTRKSDTSAAAGGAKSAVRVLDEQTVAGYDAVVLEADDPLALAKWLGDHGYDARPALDAWLAPYVAAKWKITAFKVATRGRPHREQPHSEPGAGSKTRLGTQAVRMSFETETPFFPYREPADQREPAPSGAPPDAPRDLLVYVVAAQRLSPSIGRTGAFPGSIPFAKHVGSALPKSVEDLLPEKDPFVTVLVDPSTPRPGTDELYLVPSGDQSEVEPPVVVQIQRRPFFIPIEGVVLVAGFGALCFHLVRKTRRAAR